WPVKLARNEPVLLAQTPRQQKRRAGIALCSHIGLNKIEIELEVWRRAAGLRKPADPSLPFTGFLRFPGVEPVKPGPGMRIDETKAALFFLKIVQAENQDDVLDDIGEVSRVIGVAIVHAWF